MKKILVIGSINIDLVTSTGDIPKPGETVIGKGFNTFPGGKGGNQAVAAGKLGADVAMVGKVGQDAYGQMALQTLSAAGVKTDFVDADATAGTGIAAISVSQSGQNCIIVVPGANARLTADVVEACKKAIDDCDILLLQLEVPLEAVEYAAQYAFCRGKIVILDPAPAMPLPDSLLQSVSYLTPNETEIETLTGMRCDTRENIYQAAQSLLKRGAGKVINKAGSAGAYLITRSGMDHISGFKVAAVDTTAAGDTFNAAFAFSLARGMAETESIRYANAAAAISVTKLGAQSAMPSPEEVSTLLK